MAKDREELKKLIKRDSKGRFVKGTPSGLGGRKVGSVNKVSKEVGMWLAEFLNHNTKDLQKDFDQLPPKDKFAVICNLMPYLLPKKKETTIDLQQQEVINIANSIHNINQLFGIAPQETEYTEVNATDEK